MKARKRVASRVSSFTALEMGVLLLAGAGLVAAGCGGGSAYTIDEARLARSYIASEADVPGHPDSLASVTIREKENTIDVELDGSYEQIMRNWSSTWISQSSGRAFDTRLPYKSFATLWGRDMSIAALAADEGIEGLSKELALERIEQREREHRQTIQIDLYRFVGSPPTGGGINSTLVGRPGSRVVLRDGQGHEYRPAHIENSPPREASVIGQRTVYRRNTFVFQRDVDGRDLLEDVEMLRLYVNQSLGGRYYFTWTWEDLRDTTASP